ncbi:MAG: hypothetical protein BJ554DRAFT_4371, partial [Olpidium bornovanus]
MAVDACAPSGRRRSEAGPPFVTSPPLLPSRAPDRRAFAIGRWVGQIDEGGHEHLVLYWSRKIQNREMRYCVYEQELLAFGKVHTAEPEPERSGSGAAGGGATGGHRAALGGSEAAVQRAGTGWWKGKARPVHRGGRFDGHIKAKSLQALQRVHGYKVGTGDTGATESASTADPSKSISTGSL